MLWKKEIFLVLPWNRTTIHRTSNAETSHYTLLVPQRAHTRITGLLKKKPAWQLFTER